MRKLIAAVAITGATLTVPAGAVFAQQGNGGETTTTQTTTDDGNDNWGLLGLTGLVGLAGLAGLKRRDERSSDRQRQYSNNR